MKYEVFIYNQTKVRVPKKFIEDTISKALDFLKLKQPTGLAVLIVSAEKIKKLNKIWRKKDYAPDELSFGLNSRKTEGIAKIQGAVLELGEIVINADKVSNKNNLARVLIHSLLHLLGYNHEKSKTEAQKMEHLEQRLMQNLKIKK